MPTGAPLVGDHVRLDLLTEAGLDELAPLLRAPEVYASGYVMQRCPTSHDDAIEVARTRFLARQGTTGGIGGGRTSYAVRLVADGSLGAAGTLVGTSSLWEAQLHHGTIHLDSTLYGHRWGGTQVNPAAKLLLLGHCSDDCGCGRVKIQTDLRKTRSSAAIARLGAVREGVSRPDQRREDGSLRDSVVFSVLAVEWPAVRDGLRARLDTTAHLV